MCCHVPRTVFAGGVGVGYTSSSQRRQVGLPRRLAGGFCFALSGAEHWFLFKQLLSVSFLITLGWCNSLYFTAKRSVFLSN